MGECSRYLNILENWNCWTLLGENETQSISTWYIWFVGLENWNCWTFLGENETQSISTWYMWFVGCQKIFVFWHIDSILVWHFLDLFLIHYRNLYQCDNWQSSAQFKAEMINFTFFTPILLKLSFCSFLGNYLWFNSIVHRLIAICS